MVARIRLPAHPKPFLVVDPDDVNPVVRQTLRRPNVTPFPDPPGALGGVVFPEQRSKQVETPERQTGVQAR